MKLKDILNEAPYWHVGMKQKKFTHETSIISQNTIERNHVILKQDGNTFFIIGKNEGTAGVYKKIISDIEPDNDHEITFLSIIKLFFKKKNTLINIPTDIKNKKILQVDYVETNEHFEGEGIAKELYVQLVKAGYVVLSDTAQFDGGKNLWQKIARGAIASGVSVRILDGEHGYIKDKSGEPLEYNSKNLDDKEIWSKDFDFSKSHMLLILSQ